MGSRFFDSVVGNIDLEEEDRPSLSSSYGIIVANNEDFPDEEEFINRLESFREYLTTNEEQSKKLICRADDSEHIDCEFVFDKKLDKVKFNNIIIRFDDNDYVRIQTDSVRIDGNELILWVRVEIYW